MRCHLRGTPGALAQRTSGSPRRSDSGLVAMSARIKDRGKRLGREWRVYRGVVNMRIELPTHADAGISARMRPKKVHHRF